MRQSPELREMDGVVALDTETATSEAASVCQIGVAWTDTDAPGGIRITTWLIQPPANSYESENIAVHGIRPTDTLDAPRICEIWDQVAHCLEGRLVIGHSLDFDLTAIAASASYCGRHVDFSRYRTGDTLAIAHLVLPGRTAPYKLKNLATHYGIPAGKSHDAGDDAATCLRLGGRLLAESRASSFADLAAAADIGAEARRQEAARRVARNSTDPASDKQLGFLGRLLAERGMPAEMPAGLTKGAASRAIDQVKSGGGYPF